MEVSRSTEIRVGVVSLAGLLLLILGIMLGKGLSFSASAVTLKVRLPVSGGVEVGSPVVVNGVKRGSVNSVQNDGGSVLVQAEIDNTADMHSDATALVSILEITGGKKVELFPGTNAAPLNVNQEIPGKVALDIGAAMSMLGEVGPDATKLIRRLDSIAASVNGLLADGEVMRDVRSIASDGALLAKDARALVNDNKAALTSTIRSAQALVEEIRTAVANNEPKLSKLVDNLSRTVDSLNGTMRKVDRVVVNADTLINRVNTTVGDIRNGKGAVSMLLYDENFRRQLDSTIVTLTNFIREAHQYGINVNVGLGHEP